jgi:hypothetical protein
MKYFLTKSQNQTEKKMTQNSLFFDLLINKLKNYLIEKKDFELKY